MKLWIPASALQDRKRYRSGQSTAVAFSQTKTSTEHCRLMAAAEGPRGEVRLLDVTDGAFRGIPSTLENRRTGKTLPKGFRILRAVSLSGRRGRRRLYDGRYTMLREAHHYLIDRCIREDRQEIENPNRSILLDALESGQGRIKKMRRGKLDLRTRRRFPIETTCQAEILCRNDDVRCHESSLDIGERRGSLTMWRAYHVKCEFHCNLHIWAQ